MKIYIKVKPRSKIEKVEKISEQHYVFWVKEPPVEGRANDALISLAAKYFRVNKMMVRIVSGQSSRYKLIEIG